MQKNKWKSMYRKRRETVGLTDRTTPALSLILLNISINSLLLSSGSNTTTHYLFDRLLHLYLVSAGLSTIR